MIAIALYAPENQDVVEPGRCAVPWGVCPDHGGTLRSNVDRGSWCTDPVCFNAWPYDRLDAPCPEPAAHTVRADDGSTVYGVCHGHAIAARAQIVGGQVLPDAPAAG
ncbi:hypothetical protein [Kitasatospora purpeofusca]|uniref:hypothetical protein n=1 Tax=Kitasatospora purpeofusca TaxID=67352 RepID=UPI0036D275A3